MMLRDEDIKPTLPQPTGDFTGQDPQTMEEMFRPPAEPLPPVAPMKVRTADASGEVPLPNQRTPDPEKKPDAELKSHIKADDTRYKDPQNLIMGNVMMGGMLPWAQAAADVASGRVPKEQFDEVRMEHQRRIEELESQHAEFKGAAEKAMPFLEGLGFSITKGASTVKGAMAGGAAVAAPQGAARGYSSGPVEEPSASGTRAAAAAGGAITNAAMGAAGGAAGAGASKLIGKTTSMVAERAARKAEETAALKLDNEAKAASLAKDAKKQATVDKTANTKRLNAMDKETTARTAAYNKTLQEDYKRHVAMPEGPSKHWEENRKVFIADPVHAFNQAAEAGMGLEGLSKALNLPQSVVLARLGGKNVNVTGPGHEKLLNDMLEVDRVGREFKQMSKDMRTNEKATEGVIAREVQRRQQTMDENAQTGTGKLKQDSVPEGTKAPTYPKAKAPAGEFNPPKGKDPRTRAKNDNAPPVGKPPKKPKLPDYIRPRPEPDRPQGRGGRKPRK